MATATAPSGFGRPIWNAIKGGNQVHGVGLTPVTYNFVMENTASGTYPVYDPIITIGAPSVCGNWKLEAAYIVLGTDVHVGSSTNGATIGICIGQGDALDAGDAGYDVVTTSDYSTIVSASVATGAAYDLGVAGPEAASPKNVFLAQNDHVALKTTKVASGQDNSTVTGVLTLLFRVSPPGR